MSMEERYGALLAAVRPAIIESEEDHDRLLSEAERLMEKGETLALEEEKLLALLVFLIEAFEASIEMDEEADSGEEEAPPKPHETLQRLLTSRQLEIADIADIFGSPHVAREVLAGERAISKGQSKRLGEFFRVPAKLFQE